MSEKKQIKELKLAVSELRCDFGNPKVIKSKDLDALKASIRDNGAFGVIVINESKQVLSGNQRIKAMLELGMGESKVLCKMLIGYSLEEQKRVLLEANANRGKYVLKDLDSFLSGTNLDMKNFNISSSLARANEFGSVYKGSEIRILPLVIAETQEEYNEFMKLKEIYGVKKNIQVIKKILKEKLTEVKL